MASVSYRTMKRDGFSKLSNYEREMASVSYRTMKRDGFSKLSNYEKRWLQ